MMTVLRHIARLTALCIKGPGGLLGVLQFLVVVALGLIGVRIGVLLITWNADFYNAIQKLDVPDPLDESGRTVLDNSCVVWLSECNPGHGSESVPCFFVGGAAGALRTGTFVEATGATNKHLLKAIARAMGVPDAATGHLGATALTEVLS